MHIKKYENFQCANKSCTLRHMKILKCANTEEGTFEKYQVAGRCLPVGYNNTRDPAMMKMKTMTDQEEDNILCSKLQKYEFEMKYVQDIIRTAHQSLHIIVAMRNMTIINNEEEQK